MEISTYTEVKPICFSFEVNVPHSFSNCKDEQVTARALNYLFISSFSQSTLEGSQTKASPSGGITSNQHFIYCLFSKTQPFAGGN